MTFGSFLKQTLTKACIYFSFITAAYAGLAMIINVDDKLVLLDASRILLFFVASILFAVGNMLLALQRLGMGIRIFLHYALYLITVYICFMLPIKPEASATIVALALFSVVYAICLAVFLVVKSRYKTRSEKNQEYRPNFKK